jgi:putative transposase
MTPEPLKHRKRVKHFHEPGDLHLLTFSCFRRLPLLTNDVWRTLLAKAVDKAMETHRWRLAAYVFMPEHVHLLTYPLPRESAADILESLEDLLKAIKQPHSVRIKELLVEAKSPLLADLTVHQRPGVTAFRYWQEGPGHDRNIDDARGAQGAIDYIHMNPVKRRLVKQASQWKWSSARWYLRDPACVALDWPLVHGLPAEYLA